MAEEEDDDDSGDDEVGWASSFTPAATFRNVTVMGRCFLQDGGVNGEVDSEEDDEDEEEDDEDEGKNSYPLNTWINAT